MYLVDESSLASTNQIREFFSRLGAHDRVLLVGDIRQHQGVEAGRPFEQLQEAGTRTFSLDDIVRQQDPALKSTVELLPPAKWPLHSKHSNSSLLERVPARGELRPYGSHRRAGKSSPCATQKRA